MGHNQNPTRRSQLKQLLCVAIISLVCLAACAGEAPPPPAPTLDPIQEQGSQVFQADCAICHAISPETVVRGPSVYGIVNRAATRVEGQDARAYIYNSILRPSDYLVDGFEDIMPSNLAKDLTGEQLDAVVAYLLTFDQEP